MPRPGFRVSFLLLSLLCRRRPVLQSLLRILREHRGVLRWTGSFSWPESAWKQTLSVNLAKRVATNVFRPDRLVTLPALLPSEERSVRMLDASLRAWLDAASSWQLIVPGGPFWTDAELEAWRTALKSPISALFSLVWDLSLGLARLEVAIARLFRRVSFGIDSRRGIR